MKIVQRFIGIATGLGMAASIIMTPMTAGAAGSGTFLVSPAGGTYNQGSTFSVTIGENSGANEIDSARANLAYDAGALQVVGFNTAGNPFTTCVNPASASGGVITTGDCTVLGSKKQGYQTLATVTFKVLAGSGSAALSFSGNSQLVNNGIDLSWTAVNGNYAFSTPPTSGGDGGTGGGNPGGSTGGSTGNTGGSTGNSGRSKTTNSTNNGTVASETTNQAPNAETNAATPEATKDDTKKLDDKKDETEKTADKSNGGAWLWLVMLLALFAGYYYAVMRRRKAQAPADKAKKTKEAEAALTAAMATAKAKADAKEPKADNVPAPAKKNSKNNKARSGKKNRRS